MQTTVIEVLKSSAIPAKGPGEPLPEDARLTNLGIDSLGIVLVFVELSTRTGLSFERQEGMEPLRTVGDIMQFALRLAQSNERALNALQGSSTLVVPD